MDDILSPVVRIFLRYFGAALFAKAGLQIDVADPDVITVAQAAVGALCAAAAEFWYVLARKRGWGR